MEKEKLYSNRLSDFLLLQFVHKRLNLCIPNPVYLAWCRKQTSLRTSKLSQTLRIHNIIIEMSFANIFTKGSVKKSCHPSGGVWIFSGITQ